MYKNVTTLWTRAITWQKEAAVQCLHSMYNYNGKNRPVARLLGGGGIREMPKASIGAGFREAFPRKNDYLWRKFCIFVHFHTVLDSLITMQPNPSIHNRNLAFLQIQTEHDRMMSASRNPVNSQQLQNLKNTSHVSQTRHICMKLNIQIRKSTYILRMHVERSL